MRYIAKERNAEASENVDVLRMILAAASSAAPSDSSVFYSTGIGVVVMAFLSSFLGEYY